MITAEQARALSVGSERDILKVAEDVITRNAKSFKRSTNLLSYPWDSEDSLGRFYRKQLEELGYNVEFEKADFYNYTVVSW